MKNEDNIIDKNLEIMESQARKKDRMEHFHFLRYLISIQSMHKWDRINQYKDDYMNTLRKQLKKYDDRD